MSVCVLHLILKASNAVSISIPRSQLDSKSSLEIDCSSYYTPIDSTMWDHRKMNLMFTLSKQGVNKVLREKVTKKV